MRYALAASISAGVATALVLAAIGAGVGPVGAGVTRMGALQAVNGKPMARHVSVFITCTLFTRLQKRFMLI
jgi:hypothetical protein